MNDRRPALRVGLLVEDPFVSAWEAAAIEWISRSKAAEVVVVAVAQTPPPTRRNGGSLFRLLARLDRRFFGTTPDPLDSRSLSALLPEVPRVTLKRGVGETVGDEDVNELRLARLDVIVGFGKALPPAEIVNTARCGFWTLRHGEAGTEDSLVALWEVLAGREVCRSELRVARGTDSAEAVLADTYTATYQSSPEITRGRVLWKAWSLIVRHLERLQALGPEVFFKRAVSVSDERDARSAKPAPENLRMVLLGARHGACFLRRRVHRSIFPRQWVLLFRLGPGVSTRIADYRMIIPPQDRFWADPQVIRRGDQYYVYFEDYQYAKQKGVISLIVIEADGTHTDPVPVLEQPYHLSYPFLLELQGETYMIPETAGNRTVEAYRCVRFPDVWEAAGTLLTGAQFYDPTLVYYGDKWWLFATRPAHAGAHRSDELVLYYGDNPIGDNWTLHPESPVVSDARRARPAGPLLRMNGQLCRPSQDCTGEYGSRVRINQVVQLDTGRYEEREILTVSGDWRSRIAAVHSFATADGITLLDGKLARNRLWRGLRR